MARVAREVHGRLAGGVAAAHHQHVLVAAGECLGERGAVVDAAAGELVDPSGVEPAVRHAGGDEEHARRQLAVVAEGEHVVAPVDAHARHLLRGEDLRPEPPRLGDGAACEVAAGEPGGEAEIVLDVAARPRLSARRLALDEQRVQPLAGAVDRRRQPRRPAAHHHEIVERLLGARAQAEPGGHLGGLRVQQLGAVGEEHGGERRLARPRALRPRQPLGQRARLVRQLHVQPAEGDQVAAEEVAQRVRPRRPPVADHAHALVWRAVARLPVVEQVVEVRIEVLLGRIPGLGEVVVDPHLVDGADGGVGVGVGGEQHAPGVRRARDRRGQQLHARHLGHALVHEQERDRVAALGQAVEQGERRRPRRGLQHAIALAVVAPQVALDGARHLGVVVDGEQDGFRAGHATGRDEVRRRRAAPTGRAPRSGARATGGARRRTSHRAPSRA